MRRAGILRGDPARVIQSVSDIEGSGVVHRSSLHIKVPMSEMVEAQALDPVPSVPSPQAALWEFVALPAHGSLAFQPPEVTGAEETGSGERAAGAASLIDHG